MTKKFLTFSFAKTKTKKLGPISENVKSPINVGLQNVKIYLWVLGIKKSISYQTFKVRLCTFLAHEGKLRDRINDYRSICQNIQLPYADPRGEESELLLFLKSFQA